MTCPDENFFARVQAGVLDAGELAEFHRHLDQCPDCFQLASLLGSLGAQIADPNVGMSSQISQTAPSVKITTELAASRKAGWSSPKSRRLLAATQAVMGLCSVGCCYLLSPTLLSFSRGNTDQLRGLFGNALVRLAFLPYLAGWLVIGAIWAFVNAFALISRHNLSRMALWAHAWLSIPTVMLAPLSLCMFHLLKSRREAI
jgi:hypothetical protein